MYNSMKIISLAAVASVAMTFSANAKTALVSASVVGSAKTTGVVAGDGETALVSAETALVSASVVRSAKTTGVVAGDGGCGSASAMRKSYASGFSAMRKMRNSYASEFNASESLLSALTADEGKKKKKCTSTSTTKTEEGTPPRITGAKCTLKDADGNVIGTYDVPSSSFQCIGSYCSGLCAGHNNNLSSSTIAIGVGRIAFD